MPRRLGILAAACLLGLTIPACGGDEEEPATAPKRPELTVPGDTETSPSPAPTATQTAPATTAPPAQTAPSTTPTPPDSPQNDVPPPPGSPAERFEKFCDENPGACG